MATPAGDEKAVANKISTETCFICGDEVPSAKAINCCSDLTHGALCETCNCEYIESVISSAYLGSCPAVKCPNPGCLKKGKIWRYVEWKKHVKKDLSDQYCKLAGALMAFLCGGCHSLKNQDVGYVESSESTEALLKYCGTTSGSVSLSNIHHTLMSFQHGDLSVEQCYQELVAKIILDLSNFEDYPAFEIFVHILQSIEDPERRVNLHLRYLRDRPRFKTICCKKEHCWRCKMRDFHTGKTCLDASGQLENNIVNCPQCGIALARGDGCNSITCVCGKSFSWTTEKKNQERSSAFHQAYPDKTSENCVTVLCEGPTLQPSVESAVMDQAKAWRLRNRMEVDRHFRSWFGRKFSPYPAQTFILLDMKKQTDGMCEAANVWKAEKDNAAAVETRRREKKKADESLFHTFYPDPNDQPAAAWRLMGPHGARFDCGTTHAKLIASAKLYATAYKVEYTRGVLEMEARSARQFLFAFGNKSPFERLIGHASTDELPCATEWAENSCELLQYNENRTSAERVGGVSCFPAAFATVPAERSTFTVQITKASRSVNWLTFGVAPISFKKANSDGVGRNADSWGIAEDRCGSCKPAKMMNSRQTESEFRSLQENDILTAILDTAQGSLKVKVNNGEIEHDFVIPAGSPDTYVFACTFANDHELTILDQRLTVQLNKEPKLATADDDDDEGCQKVNGVPMNTQQAKSLQYLKKHVLMMMDEKKEKDIRQPYDKDKLGDGAGRLYDGDEPSPLLTCGQKFEVEICRGDRDLMTERLCLLKDKLKSVLSGSDDTSQSMPWLTWNILVDAASCFHENRTYMRSVQQRKRAAEFLHEYGDDAPFIAALNLSECRAHKVDAEEMSTSLAFARVYAEDMNNWYNSDAKSVEPILLNVPSKCGCIPRHQSRCPHS